MSYLVDALRKAEHERHQGASSNVAALAGRLPQKNHAGPGITGWVVLLLVACNLLLFAYLFWPRADAGNSKSVQSTPFVATTVVGETRPSPQGSVPAAATGRPSSRSVASAAPAPDTPPVAVESRSVTSTASPANKGRSNGTRRVAAESVDVPEVSIHGHLYSGNPAESFILVNGRIYHEGEHLPNGVTVVRIEREGALLSYRGRRFHVSGPG